jgi:hypothetical protein
MALSWFRCLLAALSPWRPAFDPRSVNVRFVVGKVTLSKVFVSSCQYHSTNVPYPPPFTCCSYLKDREAKPGNLPKKNNLSENGAHRIEKYLHFFFPLKI